LFAHLRFVPVLCYIVPPSPPDLRGSIDPYDITWARLISSLFVFTILTYNVSSTGTQRRQRDDSGKTRDWYNRPARYIPSMPMSKPDRIYSQSGTPVCGMPLISIIVGLDIAFHYCRTKRSRERRVDGGTHGIERAALRMFQTVSFVQGCN
jgi:hypothetical protein